MSDLQDKLAALSKHELPAELKAGVQLLVILQSHINSWSDEELNEFKGLDLEGLIEWSGLSPLPR